MGYAPQPNLTSPQVAKMPDELFHQLRNFIYGRTGIFFADNKKYLLESRVSRRVTALGLDTFRDYFAALMNGTGATEVSHLVNAITINETFFFRNEPQFGALETIILPELIENKRKSGTNKVRIWSAASSSGEEPYTIAMILREKFAPRYPTMRFEIIGTDINTQVLDSARRGVYKDYSIRNIPKYYMDKYFRQDGDKFVLADEIKKSVEFKQLNLFEKDSMRMMRDFDVVFAANVLIYFDFNSKQTVVSSIYNSLNRGGYFFVGYSETLYGLSQALKPVHFDKAIAYRKE